MNILIIGATSAIAQATAKRYAKPGNTLFLVGRNADKLAIVAADLRARGCDKLYSHAIDLREVSQHAELLQQITAQLTSIDITLIAHGTLPDQQACEKDYQTAFDELQSNCLSVISLLTLLANQIEQQGHGTVAVITSVAGNRGRQSNYLYGTAKGAVSLFLQGLRNRFGRNDKVSFIDIRPGFVDTPMTQQFDKGILWAKPEAIAAGIEIAIEKRKGVVYLPWFWRLIMLIIRSIPERIFNRMKL